MQKKSKHFFGMTNTRPVFIIGTGRSGTHWLARTLGSHQEIEATFESEPMFGLSTRIALDVSLEERLIGTLIEAYKRQLNLSEARFYVDKAHPNIWIAEKLKSAFPKALFVGIERNPYATVASMMKHKGVSGWHSKWKDFPIPNRFLGTTLESKSSYGGLSLASQSAMRWIAHHNRMDELSLVLENALVVISYEEFTKNTDQVIQKLQEFLNLNHAIPIPEVKTESLDKWKQQLSHGEIRQIQAIVGFTPNLD